MRKLMLLGFILLLFACSESETEDLENNPSIPGNSENGEWTRDVVLIHDTFEGSEIIVAGNARDQFIVSFDRTLNGTLLEFSESALPLPVIMDDNEGNSWDIFGLAVEGPRKGESLVPTQSLMGYWFSFATFYPGLQIYPGLDKGVNDGATISGTGDWLVPENEVRSGGVGRDGIPAISEPQFEDTYQSTFLDDDDLVVGIAYGGEIVAYPHDVLDWHEIVNDAISDLSYAIIYCPLTGTATAWDREIDGKVTSFGVSGLLYNTNIVPYDRATSSNWSQLYDGAIWGENKGLKAKNYMVLETTFKTWEQLYPESRLMNFETGYGRNYGTYPYGDYKQSLSLIFPVKYEDPRLHLKERVHAIIKNGNARVYRFNSFTGK